MVIKVIRMLPRETCRLAVLSLALLTLPGTVLAQEPLAALIQSALASHPALRAQSGMRQAAQAGVEGAKWQYWPTPSLGVERANTDDPAYRGDKTVTTLRLQQPLWTGGRLDGNLSKAEAQAVIAQADMEATRQQLALRVVQAWSEAKAAQGKQTAYRQSRDVHARLLALVERRTREGASAQADIDLALSRLDGTEADLATARAQYDTALDKLRLLTGRPLASGEVGDVADSERPNLDLEIGKLLAAARERSPQIAKARAQEHVADADVAVAKAALSPEVYLRVERQYGNLSLPGQDPQNRVFIGLSTALGGGLSSLSGVDATRARQRAAQEDIQTQQLSVDEQVRSDATVFRSADERRQRLEQVRRSSAQITASWERQFLAGRKQWQDLMNAAREQTQNDIQLADTLASQQLTGWRLSILCQGVDAALAEPRAAQRPPNAGPLGGADQVKASKATPALAADPVR